MKQFYTMMHGQKNIKGWICFRTCWVLGYLDVRRCSRGFGKICSEKPYNLYFSPFILFRRLKEMRLAQYTARMKIQEFTHFGIILKCVCVCVCTGLIWLRIKPNGHIFWKQQWTFETHERRVSYWRNEPLSASKEEVCY